MISIEKKNEMSTFLEKIKSDFWFSIETRSNARELFVVLSPARVCLPYNKTTEYDIISEDVVGTVASLLGTSFVRCGRVMSESTRREKGISSYHDVKTKRKRVIHSNRVTRSTDLNNNTYFICAQQPTTVAGVNHANVNFSSVPKTNVEYASCKRYEQQ